GQPPRQVIRVRGTPCAYGSRYFTSFRVGSKTGPVGQLPVEPGEPEYLPQQFRVPDLFRVVSHPTTGGRCHFRPPVFLHKLRKIAPVPSGQGGKWAKAPLAAAHVQLSPQKVHDFARCWGAALCFSQPLEEKVCRVPLLD